MSNLLRVITQNAVGTTSERSNVCRLSEALRSLSIEATTARSQQFLSRFDDVIAAADAVSGLSDLADEIAKECRPAESQELKRQLQILIGSYPNASKADLSIYGVALAEDVAGERPPIAALVNACRKLRRNSTFVPAIAEVLDVLARETMQLQTEIESIRLFGERLAAAKSAVEEARARITNNFERLVVIARRQLTNADNTNWLPGEVVAEARRRNATVSISDEAAEGMRKRLNELPGLRSMPKKDAGWAE